MAGNMLLAVDIGNTSTSIGVFEDEALRASWQLGSVIHRMPDEYASLLLTLLRQQGLDAGDISRVVACSVVPPLTATFEELFRRYFAAAPMLVEAGTKTGVRIRMDNPREVGADRIVNAAAAHHLYPGAAIVVDMGTATTFDTVSAEGDYLGGAIAPGIATAAQAMFERTAMLPRIELTRPKRAIGTNTITAMQSGIIYGYVGLVEAIVGRIKAELGQQVRVIATGGYAGLIAAETKVFDVVKPDLTLIGLRLIYLMNRA